MKRGEEEKGREGGMEEKGRKKKERSNGRGKGEGNIKTEVGQRAKKSRTL